MGCSHGDEWGYGVVGVVVVMVMSEVVRSGRCGVGMVKSGGGGWSVM